MERIRRACLGHSASTGGLNLPDIRRLAAENGIDNRGSRGEVLNRLCSHLNLPQNYSLLTKKRQAVAAIPPPRRAGEARPLRLRQPQPEQRPVRPEQRPVRPEQRPVTPITHKQIIAACKGKTKKEGGLNLDKIKQLALEHDIVPEGTRDQILSKLCKLGIKGPKAPITFINMDRFIPPLLRNVSISYARVPDRVADLVRNNIDDMNQFNFNGLHIVNLLLMNCYYHDKGDNTKLNQVYRELGDFVIEPYFIERRFPPSEPVFNYLLTQLQKQITIGNLESRLHSLLSIIARTIRPVRNVYLFSYIGSLIRFETKKLGVILPNMIQIKALNGESFFPMFLHTILFYNLDQVQPVVGGLFRPNSPPEKITVLYIKFLLALAQQSADNLIRLRVNINVDTYLTNLGAPLSRVDIDRYFPTGDIDVYRQGVNVHNYDQKVRQAIGKLEIAQGINREEDYINFINWLAENIPDQGRDSKIDNALLALGLKRVGARLVLFRLPALRWPPLLISDDWSIFGKKIDGKELIGRLFRFAREFKSGREFKEIMTALINALDDGLDVCNPGKAGRLVTAVLQGRLKGVLIDQGLQQQQQELVDVGPIANKRVLAKIWDAINTALQRIPDYYQDSEGNLDVEKYWLNIIKLINTMKSTGLPGVKRSWQRRVHIPSLVLYIRAEGAIQDITFEDREIDIPLNVLEPPIDERAAALPE